MLDGQRSSVHHSMDYKGLMGKYLFLNRKYNGFNNMNLRLVPDLSLLSQEYVLVQAWKKTSRFIRYHNWFADTLELDLSAVNLPNFLKGIQDRIRSGEPWKPKPLRFVPAPKSQKWKIEGPVWKYDDNEKISINDRIRPLAYVALEDQVLATAILLCLADRVESAQGDPRLDVRKSENLVKVVSYGNRLLCDREKDRLYHRWASMKYYRSYFQDYHSFLTRTSYIVVDKYKKEDRDRVAIIQTDLSKFYDRVRPNHLHQNILKFQKCGKESAFFDFAKSVLQWDWHEEDLEEVKNYALESSIDGFESIALPQGLTASGFFANVVLLPFDRILINNFCKEIVPGVLLIDACRYVDDLRCVIEIKDQDVDQNNIKSQILGWLNETLKRTSPDLEFSENEKKTNIFLHKNSDTIMINLSKNVDHIQKNISGGFDAHGGIETIEAIEGLFNIQHKFPFSSPDDIFQTSVDIRDETIARFSAGKFRSTFRSLRPLLSNLADEQEDEDNFDENTPFLSTTLSQEELDSKAKVFSLRLIQKWISDPSNVRILRIALDVYPDKDILTKILQYLIGNIISKKSKINNLNAYRVSCYCLSEIFRAGAIETGIVQDNESLPKDITVDEYHNKLEKQAVQLFKKIEKNENQFPWYLNQQIFLYLATRHKTGLKIKIPQNNGILTSYWKLLYFQQERKIDPECEWALYAAVDILAFSSGDISNSSIVSSLTPSRVETLAEIAPRLVENLICTPSIKLRQFISQSLNKLGFNSNKIKLNDQSSSLSLTDLVKAQPNPLLSEDNLLQFTSKLTQERKRNKQGQLNPGQILVNVKKRETFNESRGPGAWKIESVTIKANRQSSKFFSIPEWVSEKDKWRIEIGQILRYVLTGSFDYARSIDQYNDKNKNIHCYKSPRSHWLESRYGYYHGHESFGGHWVPLSEWTMDMLYELLRWPGCQAYRFSKRWNVIENFEIDLTDRIIVIEEMRGKQSGLLIMTQNAPPPRKDNKRSKRKLRVGLIQSAYPKKDDINNLDILSSDEYQIKSGRHLCAILSAVEQLLRVRLTHCTEAGIDWLIFPELAIHPKQIQKYLIPFVRKHKCLILTGLTYHPHQWLDKLINSSIWMIPEWKASKGFQIKILEQGKEHLAHIEDNSIIQGFRPCQWIVEYNLGKDDTHLNLTSSICYDATDLSLAADLRNLSDIYAVSALNKDISTFDTMVQALHYHMYQVVILANNASYGGSNTYAPYKQAYEKQILHLHGQPQATVSFIDLDPEEILTRGEEWSQQNTSSNNATQEPPETKWKCPPAGIDRKK